MRGLADTDGFTLVELLLTVALVSLVITGGFRLYYFADRSFVSGTLTADVQTDVQIAIRRITEELSLAHFVEFGRLPESSLDAADHFIYVNSKGQVVLHRHNGIQFLTSADPEAVQYALSFEAVAEIPNTVHVSLASENERVPYRLETDIQVLNIRLSGFKGTTPSTSVYFTKEPSQEEREAAEDFRRICLITSVFMDPDDPDAHTLRRFRDEVLEKSRFGRTVVRWYYRSSPYWVAVLDDMPVLSNILRICVEAVVFWLEWQAIITVVTWLLVAVFLGFSLMSKRGLVLN